MQLQLQNPKLDTLPFEHGGSPPAATSEEGLSRLELWLAFWHFCYRQWGGFMQLVGFLMFISLHVTLSTLLEFMALHFSI
jgi:hypothetical protein